MPFERLTHPLFLTFDPSPILHTSPQKTWRTNPISQPEEKGVETRIWLSWGWFSALEEGAHLLTLHNQLYFQTIQYW
jgi:hypothetical protein